MVHKSEQGESNMQFLQNAKDLQLYTLHKVIKFPKRYTFFICIPLYNIARRIHENVELGNSIPPTNQHEAQMRRDCFIKAKAECFNLTSQIEDAYDALHFSKDIMKEWSRMIDLEENLLKGLMESDKRRYKNLP